jgi:hypothetical protein
LEHGLLVVEELLERTMGVVGDDIPAPEVVDHGAFGAQGIETVASAGLAVKLGVGAGFALRGELGEAVFVFGDDEGERGGFRPGGLSCFRSTQVIEAALDGGDAGQPVFLFPSIVGPEAEFADQGF